MDETAAYVQAFAILFVTMVAFMSLQRRVPHQPRTEDPPLPERGDALMVSAGTLHVIATELAIGAYATAGVAFLLAGLASHGLFGLGRHLRTATSRPTSP